MYTSIDAPARVLNVADETVLVSDSLVAALVALEWREQSPPHWRTSYSLPPMSIMPNSLAFRASHWI